VKLGWSSCDSALLVAVYDPFLLRWCLLGKMPPCLMLFEADAVVTLPWYWCSVHVVLPWTRPQRHIADAEFVLTEALKVCPNGALFLWMAGRLERLKRNLDESVAVI
jgi:hypothetical protein